MAPLWLWERHLWRYYYRALAQHQPSLAKILGGADVFYRPTSANGPYQPTKTRAEMTFRHLNSRGDPGLRYGTNRVSVGRYLKLIYEVSLRGNNTGEIIRVDPRVTAKEGGGFLSPKDLLADLAAWEQETLRELQEARKANSKNKIERFENRLQEIQKARAQVKLRGEGQAIEKIPSKAIKPVKVASPASQAWARQGVRGLRVGGGVLMVYGVYHSATRISAAPVEHRNRVISQEAGGWAGGLAGAWAVGSLFAMGGAAVGVPAGGVGALIVGGAGAIVGGILGGIGGALGADWVYTMIEKDNTSKETDTKQACHLLMGKPPTALPYHSAVSGSLVLPPEWPH